ncbi:40S ribosomal protein S20 [Armadillidium nasatum]|uniref:40S ribosomal protein S20 n=1 Tax=Armadillidium nasatum TaxID=96803 RepID=A0A5N5SVW6_9CRUS|nr:40S ribosomal protein S20 [Armadillidium nasatum]
MGFLLIRKLGLRLFVFLCVAVKVFHSLEKVCTELVRGAKDEKLKTPCGEVIDLHSPSEVVKQITSISIEPDVDVEVTIAE